MRPRMNADHRGLESDHGDHPITRDHGDQRKLLYIRSNSAFSFGFGDGNPSTTCFAQSKYWRRRSWFQSAGGLWRTERRLEILSASLSVCPRGDFLGAFATCSALRAAFGSVLSSVTSATRSAMSDPKLCANSSLVTPVSSTVSCRKAAMMSSGSS